MNGQDWAPGEKKDPPLTARLAASRQKKKHNLNNENEKGWDLLRKKRIQTWREHNKTWPWRAGCINTKRWRTHYNRRRPKQTRLERTISPCQASRGESLAVTKTRLQHPPPAAWLGADTHSCPTFNARRHTYVRTYVQLGRRRCPARVGTIYFPPNLITRRGKRKMDASFTSSYYSRYCSKHTPAVNRDEVNDKECLIGHRSDRKYNLHLESGFNVKR